MSKKEKFRQCTICDKTIWADMYALHLRNVHNYDLSGATAKAYKDIKNSAALKKESEPHGGNNQKKREKKQGKLKMPPITKKKFITRADCKIYSFIWQDIIFKTHEIQIIIQRTGKRFTPLECKNSIESLNKIKEEFFFRHDGNKLYKLVAYDQRIMLDWSEDVKEILALIESAIEFYNFRYEKNRKTRVLSEKVLHRWSNEQIFKMFYRKPEKDPYLNFLYKNHSQEFKLIPILESIGYTEEESFLFRIRDRKGMILVVWENINPARATYLFRIEEGSPTLRNILIYISEDKPAKRTFLRNDKNHKWAKSTLGYVFFIEHEGFDTYKRLVSDCFK